MNFTEIEQFLGPANQLFTLLIALTALFISLIQLKRSRRQINEDIVFKGKLQSYQEIIRTTFAFTSETYHFIEIYQEFEGSQEDWINSEMPKLFRKNYSKVRKTENNIAEYYVFLPAHFIEKLDEFMMRSTRLFVEAYHFDLEHTITSYDKLADLHDELLTMARNDLSVDTLNVKLSKRLS